MVKSSNPERSINLHRVAWLAAGIVAASAGVFYISRRSTSEPAQSVAPAPVTSPAPSKSQPSPLQQLPVRVINPTLSLLEFEPKSSAVLAVGSEGTILRSTDDGKTWRDVDTGTREYLTGTAVHAATGAILVVGSRGTLLRSDDAGATFSKVPVATERAFRAVATSDGDGRILAVGDDGMALVSMDAGRTFSVETSGTANYLSKVIALPGKNRFVASGDLGTILVRDESGKYRAAKAPAQMLITALAVMPDGSIVAGSQDGFVLNSSDGGETFVDVRKMPEETFVIGFDTNPSGGTTLARLRTREVLLSQDQGRTFAQLAFEPKQGLSTLVWLDGRGFVGLGLQGAIVSSDVEAKRWTIRSAPDLANPGTAATHPVSKTILAVGASGLIARSVDQGLHFEIVRPSLGGLLRAIAWDPTRGCIVAVGHDGTVVRSEDGGMKWSRARLAIDVTTELESVVFEPTTGAFVAAGRDATVVHSPDCGNTWTAGRVPTKKSINDLLALGEGTILALASESPILRSTNAGQSFVPTEMEGDATLRRAAMIGTPSAVVAVGNDGRVYRSTDAGRAWQRVPTNTTAHLRALQFEPASNSVWVVGDSGMLLKSTDAGASWSRISVPTTENLFAIGTNAANDLVFVGGNRGTVLRSTDRGATFTSIDSGSTQTIRVIVLDRTRNEFIVAGSGGTLLRTLEGRKLARIPGNFDGRIDAALFHPPTGTVILGGDRLYRLGGK